MKTTITKNWVVGTTPGILDNIHNNNINIAILNRGISSLNKQVTSLTDQEINFKSSGNIDTILSEIITMLPPKDYNLLLKDIENLLRLFKTTSNSESFKLLLATVNSNMCRKFHADVNDLRMLCTYVGPGTLWLPDDNINREALNNYENNESIVIDNNKIQQVETGSAVILKGAIYAKNTTNGVVHRSPTIEESGQKRLLLRIDTNEFLKHDN